MARKFLFIWYGLQQNSFHSAAAAAPPLNPPPSNPPATDTVFPSLQPAAAADQIRLNKVELNTCLIRLRLDFNLIKKDQIKPQACNHVNSRQKITTFCEVYCNFKVLVSLIDRRIHGNGASAQVRWKLHCSMRSG